MVDLVSWILPLIEWAQSLSGPFAYLGVFAVSFIGSASIFLPVPAALLVAAFGAVENPLLIGLVGGAGAALGEITGYLVGLGSHRIIRKSTRWMELANKWSKHYGMFLIIFVFAATPLPDDVTGILGGAIKYNVKKFLLAAFIGKAVLYVLIAYSGAYGIESLINILSVG